MSKYKTSYGLALCRYNQSRNNCVEILSIKKRCTYQYFSFINGFYKNRPTRQTDMAYVHYLFDNMSFQEKLTILSMNYSTMWWYIWLNNPEKGMGLFDKTQHPHLKSTEPDDKDIAQTMHDYTQYFKRKCKFEKAFLQDGGRRLYETIDNSKTCETIWEIPKGAQDAKETDLDAAIREFTEESGIPPEYYDVLYEVPPIIITYKDNGVVYRHIYYLAQLNTVGYSAPQIMKPKINFKSYKQLSEVADVRWLSLAHIALMELPNKNKKNMLRLYGEISKKFKKYCTYKPHLHVVPCNPA